MSVHSKVLLDPPPPPNHHHTHANVVKINTRGSLRMYLFWTSCTSGIYMHARWELLCMYLWWSLCTLYLHACQVRVTVNVPLVEFMYLAFTRMPGESYSGAVYVPCIYTNTRWELLWMYLWCSLCTLYLHACQVRVTVGDSDLCCCACVTYFECWLTPLSVDSARALWASFCFRFIC